MVWEVAYCGEHVEVRPESGESIECQCTPGVRFSGFVCHRCSCFTCNAIRERHRWLYPPKVYQLALDL